MPNLGDMVREQGWPCATLGSIGNIAFYDGYDQANVEQGWNACVDGTDLLFFLSKLPTFDQTLTVAAARACAASRLPALSPVRAGIVQRGIDAMDAISGTPTVSQVKRAVATACSACTRTSTFGGPNPNVVLDAQQIAAFATIVRATVTWAQVSPALEVGGSGNLQPKAAP